ncbi:MAG: GNAT family N-acetyltransferase [Firmicutes bacterium]|nr:GNAT family N-acetyltransferase [Bacillota bacterium]
MLYLVNKFREKKYGLPYEFGRHQVVLLKPWDLFQVARLEAANFPEPLSLWELFKLWLSPLTTYLVIKQGRQVAAYIGFQALGPAAHTISMCVHPAYRRQGLGMLIQRAANRVAVRLGLRWFTGEVRVSNVAQLKMLETMGWIQIGVCPRFFGNGEDAVVVLQWLERVKNG